MKKMFKAFLVAMVLTTAFVATELRAEGVGLTAGVDYSSTYLFRGQYLYGDQEGWLFPYLSYDVLGSGLSVGVSTEVSAGWLGGSSEQPDYVGENKYNHAIDFGLDYEYVIEGTATLGAGVWYYRLKDNYYSYGSGYITASLDAVPFVTPVITVTADYYTGDKTTSTPYSSSGLKYKDDNGNDDRTDIYVQAGITKSIEVTKDVATIDLGAIVGYAHYRAWGNKIDDISDIDFSVATTVITGGVALTGGFHYVIVPGTQFKETGAVNSVASGEKDIHRFYATFGASYSL